MRRLGIALVVTFAVFFAVGYTVAERTETITLSTRTDGTVFYVVATVPSVTPDYAWLDVYVCAALIDADAMAQCDPEGWASGSGKSPRADQRQYEIPFRYAPRGPKMIFAEVINRDRQVLASGRKVVLR